MDDRDIFVRLADHVCLRLLEEPYLYDCRTDDLYELNLKALRALQLCQGDRRLSQVGLEPEFLSFCLDEGLLTLSLESQPRPVRLGVAPLPSLRYLELQITWRCNLSCRHCYLGTAREVDLPLPMIAAALRELEAIGGLRVMLSGGEPLMHPQWDRVNAMLHALSLRRVLLTNGLLLDDQRLAELAVEEVQISLDGLRPGHEALRGPGSFAPALAAARRVREAGLDLSIATMAHARNLQEMEGLAQLVADLGAREWGIDAPVIHGRLLRHSNLAVTPAQAAQAMAHAFGGSYHGAGTDPQGNPMACGLHLCTVAPDATVAQCGFYLDHPLGHLPEGLWTCWQRRQPAPLAAIPACASCASAPDCGGGCRRRAPGPDQPDPVMCAAMGRGE